MTVRQLDLEGNLEVGCESHFLDSGSFSLWTKAKRYAEEHGGGPYDFYDTAEHWEYLDAYARFVKKHKAGIDLYANVDVIPNPELSWRNQRYLEKKHGLTPVPVVHFRTDLSWLARYAGRGHELIALGGMVGQPAAEVREWLDRAFAAVCPPPGRLPTVKLHGFGITNYDFLIRYCWWSVDSASWTKIGAFGGILVPHRRGGRFVFFDKSLNPLRPYIIKVALESSKKDRENGAGRRGRGLAGSGHHRDRKIEGGRHYNSISPAERRVVRLWLEEIGVPFGAVGSDGAAEEFGVCSRHSERKAANLYFFERLRAALPEWPWPFRHTPRRGGLGVA
jgi:hypothetical protein